MTISRLGLAALLVVSVAACKKPADKVSTTNVTAASPSTPSSPIATAKSEPAAPPKAFVPSHPVPPFKGAFPHRPEPMANATGRAVSIKFLRNGGDGPDLAPVFALTNLTDKPVRVAQTWLFYYDAQRKQLDSYPHGLSGSLELAPGETKEKRLGRDIDKIKKETSIIEGEVSSARVGDKEWQNENLIDLNARPAGGFDAQTLEDRAGERVIVDVYSLASKKVRLTNVTDHPVKGVDIHFYYVTAKNELESAWAPSQKLTKDLAPGESIDFTAVPISKKDVASPPGARKVVAFADEVDFSDGTPTFKSRNLGRSVRWDGLSTK